MSKTVVCHQTGTLTILIKSLNMAEPMATSRAKDQSHPALARWRVRLSAKGLCQGYYLSVARPIISIGLAVVGLIPNRSHS